MSKQPLISIIILNYNGKGILKPCIQSVLNSDYANFEIIIVDNVSTDKSMDQAKMQFGTDSRFKFIQNSENFFFAEGNNIGMRAAAGEYLFLISNDVEIGPNCLSEIAAAFRNKKIGAAQPKVFFYGSSKIDNARCVTDRYGYSKGRSTDETNTDQSNQPTEIFYTGGAAMVLRKKALDKVKLFDPKFYVYCEDVDLCWRIRLNGYRIVLLPKAKAFHRGGAATSKVAAKSNAFARKMKFHIRKNRIAMLIKNYNIWNLSLILPVVFLVNIFIFLKEILFEKDFKLAFTSLAAMGWNIKELPYLSRKRAFIQRELRIVSDKEIIKYMAKDSILFGDYIKPFFRKLFKLNKS